MEATVANSSEAMEADTILKNGQSLKCQKSRKNDLNFCKMKNIILILIAGVGSTTLFAQGLFTDHFAYSPGGTVKVKYQDITDAMLGKSHIGIYANGMLISEKYTIKKKSGELSIDMPEEMIGGVEFQVCLIKEGGNPKDFWAVPCMTTKDEGILDTTDMDILYKNYDYTSSWDFVQKADDNFEPKRNKNFLLEQFKEGNLSRKKTGIEVFAEIDDAKIREHFNQMFGRENKYDYDHYNFPVRRYLLIQLDDNNNLSSADVWQLERYQALAKYGLIRIFDTGIIHKSYAIPKKVFRIEPTEKGEKYIATENLEQYKRNRYNSGDEDVKGAWDIVPYARTGESEIITVFSGKKIKQDFLKK